jgi:hypothetical protein
MIHWWLPTIVPNCPATIKDHFTGVPEEVTCFTCRSYVEMRMANGQRN